ncbi:MAG: YigZ family protein [Salibacteraceae bacterium]
MTNPDSYKTIDQVSQGDFRDRGSKFPSYLFPCENEQQLKSFITELKKEHPGARHFCYGAIIGSRITEERNSDDGEPSGTAELPILNQLLSKDLKNAGIVVIRYFGGTKLGKPGLINAYKESARSAIDHAQIVQKFHRTLVRFVFSYDATGSVMKTIENIDHSAIVHQEFAQKCLVNVLIPDSLVEGTLPLFDHTDEVTVSIPGS